MIRRIGAILSAVSLVLAMSVAPVAAADAPADAQVQTLYAGKTTAVGTVTVWNDETTLYVKYETTGGWLLTETHVHVDTAFGQLPQNKQKNPEPGHFRDGAFYEPPVAEDTFQFALAQFDASQLYIAAHAVVVGPDCDNGPYYASQVTEYIEGANANKNDPTQALGAPDSSGPPDWTGHVNLGFEGSLTVAFDALVFNGDGSQDISIHEVSPAGSALETADVYVLADGIEYFAGTVTNSGIIDPDWVKVDWVAIPDDLTWVEAVKLVDRSSAGYNGFDVDAVDAPCLLSRTESAWADGDRFTPRGNWATYFTYDVKSWRLVETVSVPSNASAGASSSNALEAGKDYRLVATGTWHDSSTANHHIDAEYCTFDNWATHIDGTISWGPNQKDLQVDGIFVDWGAFNTEHEYTLLVPGTGAVLAFRIFDGKANATPPAIESTWYGDNVGNLTVTIYCWS